MGRKRKRFDSDNQSSAHFKNDLKSEHEYDVNCLFEKNFTYTKPSDGEWCKIQKDSPSEHWRCEELYKLKLELNYWKALLNDKKMEDWHKHTSFTNLSGNVVNSVKEKFYPEICTQAWCKFYEILCTFKPVNLDSENLNSVHLCEAPGAFVTSLNHYLSLKGYQGEWNWSATTLNPYYEGNNLREMVNDDRLIKETANNWYFGLDNSGNLMNKDNLAGICERVSQMGEIMLITADGSIDCQQNPGEQETIVSQLHYCEVLTALKLLSPGGSFILKMFTLFECESVSLVYFLNCIFEVVSVFKPSTSKSGNSEVYLICRNYEGIDTEILDILCDKYFDSTTVDNSSLEFQRVLCANRHIEHIGTQGTSYLYTKDEIPHSFINQHIECCSFFENHQVKTIENNLKLFDNMSDCDKKDIESLKSCVCDRFFALYRIRSIPRNKKITFSIVKPEQFHTLSEESKISLESSKIMLSGTFDDREKTSKLEWKLKVKEMTLYKVTNTDDIADQIFLQYHNIVPLENISNIWHCEHGKQLKTINNSKFCSSQLLHEMKQLLTNCHSSNQVDRQTSKVDQDLFYSLLRLALNTEMCSQHATVNVCVLFETALACLEDTILDNTKINRMRDLNSCSNVEIVVADCRCSEISGEEEIVTQTELLKQIIQALSVLSTGGSVICWIHTVLTRFTAGIVYSVSLLFGRVYLIPSCDHRSLSQVLVCLDYHGGNNSVIEYLQKVLTEVCCDRGLLEFVPVTVMMKNPPFKKYLTHANELVIKNFINEVLKNEKQYYDLEMQNL